MDQNQTQEVQQPMPQVTPSASPVTPMPAQQPATPAPTQMSEPKKGNGFLLVFLILLFLAVVVLGGIYYFLFLNNPVSTVSVQPQAVTPAQVVSPVSSPTPASEQDQVQSLDTGTVDAQVVDIETDAKAL